MNDIKEPLSKRDERILKEAFPDGKSFEEAKKRVENGEPLAYVIGEWYFYGLTFKLNRDCLIPRPDTEHIAETAIELIPNGGSFIDLCSGSGCIAVSVLHTRKDVTCDAVEISEAAFEISKRNAELNGVSERFGAVNSDIFKYVPHKKYDCVISNPPYIRAEVIKTLDSSVRDFEPEIALNGGEDGLRFYRHILKEYRNALTPNGRFILEIGYDQGAEIRALSSELGYKKCEIKKDYGGNDRVAVIAR